MSEITEAVRLKKTSLGIELGSTRIKAVLIGEKGNVIESGAYEWENRLENGVWTYDLADALTGVREAYAKLKNEVRETYDCVLTGFSCIGISGMMHGYLAFDRYDRLLVPFRTWRNTMTAEAAAILTERFRFNVPQRWSIAHLHQAILNGEPHVKEIRFMTTLAGYIHWRLTGVKELGIGDASGMFPIDAGTKDYDAGMLNTYRGEISGRGFEWDIARILPGVRCAGEACGKLTEAGAALLDPDGDLEAGIPFCPPEGDAGTGMAATESIRERTGNISAGTSVFAMVVLEKPLSRVYPEIDMVMTPDGKPVAMVHCNNCTSDINAYAGMLQGFLERLGENVPRSRIYETLFHAAMEGEKDCGGLVHVSFLSGEPLAGVEEGRPAFLRMPSSVMSIGNFSRSLLLGAIASLKMGMDILAREKVAIDTLLAHGGFLKTPGTAQKLLAAALDIPVTVMETAGEGGPWGMALLASYAAKRKDNETLDTYLANRIFGNVKRIEEKPSPEDREGFEAYMKRFKQALEAEKTAERAMR